jgi:hypothetical protein
MTWARTYSMKERKKINIQRFWWKKKGKRPPKTCFKLRWEDNTGS